MNRTISKGLIAAAVMIMSGPALVSAAVETVEVLPANAGAFVGVTFSLFQATAYDASGTPIPGTTFVWESSQGTINTATGSFMSTTAARDILIKATAPNGKFGTAKITVQNRGAASGRTDLNEAKAYPVPYKSNSGVPGITFEGLTANATIKIFSTDGRLVKTLRSSTGENVRWELDNMDTQKVASSVYFYRITNDAGQVKKGKLVVIQ